MAERLTSLSQVNKATKKPVYDPTNHGSGIVHLGVGAFHRAHQAVYTDTAISQKGGDWRIVGVSLRNAHTADMLEPQNGLYTLLERSIKGTQARIIGSMSGFISPSHEAGILTKALVDPNIKIVSLTVTEKAYGLDRANGGVNLQHPAIAADLNQPDAPKGVIGILVNALKTRRKENTPPFTVLCCDNLPQNGALLKAAVCDFANHFDTELGQWIEGNVAFPSTMVDRITPASTKTTYDDVEKLIGCVDLAAVETEGFCQWVIEDDFPQGRPYWEAGGALFVDDVAPYEHMKLRMLNGSHSMLAYCGHVSGHVYVRDVMENSKLANLVRRHLKAAAATLDPLPGFDIQAYGEELAERFQNPAIAHETYQIAMDGSEKLPQRIIEPALEAMARGQDLTPFAFATAAWMHYCLGRCDNGTSYPLRDPIEETIHQLVKATDGRAPSIVKALHSLTDIFPQTLVKNSDWTSNITEQLDVMVNQGMNQAIEKHTI